jgi:hypothetical protein
MRIRIGDLLVKAGVISDAQLKQALAEQHQWGGKLGDILVRMEFVTEEVLVRALSKQSGIPRADLSGEGQRGALEKVPPEMAEEFGLVPLSLQDDGRTLLVAMSDPLNIMVTDHLRSMTGCRVVAQIAGTQSIRDAISRWYRGTSLNTDSDPNSIRIVNNAGAAVAVTAVGRPRPASIGPTSSGITGAGLRAVPAPPPPPPGTGSAPGASAPPPPPAPSLSAVDVLRGVEETQRRSVAALKAMVELLIEKGVFSREEYLGRVKR